MGTHRALGLDPLVNQETDFAEIGILGGDEAIQTPNLSAATP